MLNYKSGPRRYDILSVIGDVCKKEHEPAVFLFPLGRKAVSLIPQAGDYQYIISRLRGLLKFVHTIYCRPSPLYKSSEDDNVVKAMRILAPQHNRPSGP